jgi:hypothetical protein
VSEEPKKENESVSTTPPQNKSNQAIPATEEPKSWQLQMWEEYNDEYSRELKDRCYDTSFDCLYNAVEGKTQEALLFSDPKWIPSKLIAKNLSSLQTEHLEGLKSDWIQVVKNSSMTPEKYKEHGMDVPKNYTELNAERKKLEKQYYEEATRIMFKLKIGDKEPKEISIEDYGRLERVKLKFAVDAVQFSFAKPPIKNEKTSSSLSTYG